VLFLWAIDDDFYRGLWLFGVLSWKVEKVLGEAYVYYDTNMVEHNILASNSVLRRVWMEGLEQDGLVSVEADG
jgi:hypothetical protein